MDEEHTATARGFNLPISKKFSVEVASFVRGKDLKVAKKLLEGVVVKKVAVPLRKHNRDQAHKKGPMTAGRYPVKVAKSVLQLLNSAEMNALNKGLDVDALFVSEIIANKGNGAMRYGRQRGREAKRTHLEVVLEERETLKKEKKKKSAPKKEKPKETKKEQKPKEKKAEQKEGAKKEETKKPEGDKKQ